MNRTSGPKKTEREAEGFKGRLAYLGIVRKGGEQQPMAIGLQRIDFQSAGVWVQQPEMANTLTGIDGHFQQSVGTGSGRREDFAHPIRRYRGPGGFRQAGHALPSPASEIRHQDVDPQMEFRSIENYPVIGLLLANEKLHQSCTQYRIGIGKNERTLKGMEFTIDDFANDMFG